MKIAKCKNMDPNTNSFVSSKISLQNSILEEWDTDDTLDEISLKQEIECDDIVDKLSEEEKKPLIIYLEPSCDDSLNSILSEAANESPVVSSKISLQSSIREEWDTDDTLDEISMKQEIECNDIVDKLSVEEKKPLIIDLKPSCDDILSSTPSEASNESSEILLQSDQKCRMQNKYVSNSIGKNLSVEVNGEINQKKNGTYEKLFVDLQREDLQQLQKQKHSNGKQSALCSSETKLKKIFERCLDKHSGEVLFKCLYCQFHSIHLKDMKGHVSNIHLIGSVMVQCDSSYPKVETQERICGLCLKVCDNFKAVEGDMKDALDIVLPKIDLAAIQEFVMCTHCTEILIKCFGFKTTCLNSYNYIVSFASKKDDVKLNLRDIYLSKNEIVAEDQVICGFCMEPVRNSSAISLDVEESEVILKKMIKQCLPELDLSLIEKAVICAPCHGSLEDCFRFVTNCLLVEEKIQKYCETLNVNSRGQIELSHLLQFTTRDVITNEIDIIKEEKQFCEENGNADERIIDNGADIFKLEQAFCGDSESAIEESKIFDGIKIQETFWGESESDLKEGNFCKMEDQEFPESEELKDIEIKIEEPDFMRFEDDLVLPQSEATNVEQWTVIKINSKLLYKCNSCSYTAKHKCNIKRHQLVHKDPSEVTVYTCNTCSFHSKYEGALKRHLLVHKNPSKVRVYSCNTCSYQSLYKRNFNKHLLVHKDPSEVTVYSCDTCSYQSKHKDHLKRHLLVHKNPSEVTVYSCDTCSFQSKRKTSLKKHLLVHKKASVVRVFSCDSCSYQSKYKARLERHLLAHKNPSKVTVYSCGTCSFQSKHKDRLKRHLLAHKNPSEVTTYTCDACSFQSRYRGNIHRHLLVHKDPSEVTVYSCGTCSFQSKYKDHLKRHLLVHKEMDPSKVTVYKCDTCSFQSKYKSELEKHLLAHKNPSEVTVYSCGTCSFQSKYKSRLQKHLLAHKNPSEVTVYSCGTCSFQSRHRGNFHRHLLVHKDPSEVTVYTCDTCSFHSKYKCHLKTHLLVHKDPSEVTVYTCGTCSFQSKHKTSLKKHLLIHKDLSEVTLYKCDFCSYQAKYNGDLKRHLLTHNPQQQGTNVTFIHFVQDEKLNESHLLHKSPPEVTILNNDVIPMNKRERL